MKNIGLKSAIVALAGMSFASCGDFLEIYPLTMVYEDNYWNEKADVDQIVTGCYTRMQDNDFLRRVFIWGEVRSDNIRGGSNSKYFNKEWDEGKIIDEDILSTNKYTDWSPFYSVIDRCNLVIERAPQVAEVDPSYLASDVQATIAEVTAIRALCYFYLVRTFKDVPYYTYAITNDEQPLNLPVTDGDEVVRNLIQDLQNVLPNALTAWPSVNGEDKSYARITQDAIRAMLADMSLWIGDYAAADRWAQQVIENKQRYFEENYSTNYLTDGYPLVPDGGQGMLQRGAGYALNFYGDGGGPESIFELEFTNDANDNEKGNTMVTDLYYRFYEEKDLPTGCGTYAPAIALWTEWSSPQLFKPVTGSTSNDIRRWSIAVNAVSNTTAAYMAKYAVSDMSTYMNSTTFSDVYFISGGRNWAKNDANWIFYRVSDMMLIKAEALLYMAGDDLTDERNDSLVHAAYDLIAAVSHRSATGGIDNYGSGSAASRSSLINFLFDERRREFLFEGKRWFDLVRRSRHDGNNTEYLIQQVSVKHSESASTVTGKLRNYMAMYWPYNYDEVRVNENLHQNPAYPESDDSSYESTTN